MPSSPDSLQAGAHWVVLTGAGISADSGLATFRGGGGLWEGHRVEDVATPEAWARDPQTVWRFYQMRRRALLEVEPNAGHYALARLERHLNDVGARCTLVTQNVDDLHQRAGSNVWPMHGELCKLRCERCGHLTEDREHFDFDFVPCPECDFPRLRPHIVWFGEIPMGMGEIEAALQTVTHFLACGTSGAVWPAAGFLHAARQLGARTFVNALERPENLAPQDQFLEGSASEVLPRWVAGWMGEDLPSAP